MGANGHKVVLRERVSVVKGRQCVSTTWDGCQVGSKQGVPNACTTQASLGCDSLYELGGQQNRVKAGKEVARNPVD